MRKYIFAQESFYLQSILNDINKQDTSFLDCKHKHMMKCGVPLDKFGVWYRIIISPYLYSFMCAAVYETTADATNIMTCWLN